MLGAVWYLNTALLMPSNMPTDSVVILHGLIGLAKSCLQKQTNATYIDTVSG